MESISSLSNVEASVLADQPATIGITVAQCAALMHQTMPRLVRRVASALRQHTRQVDEFVTPDQLALLHTLSGGACALNELAAEHHVTASTMSRTVDLLVRRGWVSRERDDTDRRQVVLRVTPRGQAVQHDLGSHIRHVVAGFLANATPAELARVYAGFEVLHRVVIELDERDPLADPAPCPVPGGPDDSVRLAPITV